ncbi:MAG: tetratricopeptide repeat protein, partial [Verrucomicrobiota bacterium]
IVYHHCAGCHRPGQSAPFPLLTYADAQKRARDILKVTANGLMPPWLPDPGELKFAEERRLTQRELDLISQWVEQGAIEGRLDDLPPLPKWNDDWQLGKPDLVVQMNETYTLPADGRDLYRNFVIPIPVQMPRFVRAVEIRPGNTRVVHHAVLQIDRTSTSRQLDNQDPEPGYGEGMSFGTAQIPDGHFLGWTPGKAPYAGRADLAWRLSPETDFVLQLHMRPSGKPEPIRASIALYFTEREPANFPYALVLRSKEIDIPAGESNYRVQKEFELPVAVELLSVYPHAHYLGKDLQARATLPDGTQIQLLRIRDWDFNWQDDYRYARPVFLPAGSKISMDYLFDNSPANFRNPNQPPRRVSYGRNSTDEMAELLLQVLPATAEAREVLRRIAAREALLEDIAQHERRLTSTPGDARTHRILVNRYFQLGEPDQALEHFRRASQIEPPSAQALHAVADALAETGRLDAAREFFEAALHLDPNMAPALNGLAQVLSMHPDPTKRNARNAIELAQKAVELTKQQDPSALETLAFAYAVDGQSTLTLATAEKAIALAQRQGNQPLADRIRQRLTHFQQSLSPPAQPR